MISSLRERKRYLAFEIISEQKMLDYSYVSESIYDSLESLVGMLGSAQAGVLVLEELWKSDLQKGIIKVNNRYVDKLKSSLAMIGEINNQKVIVRSIKVSGNIKKVKSYCAG